MILGRKTSFVYIYRGAALPSYVILTTNADSRMRCGGQSLDIFGRFKMDAVYKRVKLAIHFKKSPLFTQMEV